MSKSSSPVGIFDSGYGGLTVFKEIVKILPQYDYIYLGDNARVPYGIRSFETVYNYTLECVRHLFSMGCRLVIIACNTASAKALRNIQQNDLPLLEDLYKVLGVIRPTSEIIGNLSNTGHVGIMATKGTVNSLSYVIEIEKFFPHLKVFQQACPMFVPLVEENEHHHEGSDYFIQKYIDGLLSQSPHIDTIVLACTHYPLLMNKIEQFLPVQIKLLSQGEIVAKSLKDYLIRHPEVESLCSRNRNHVFYTTESTNDFNRKATTFFGSPVESRLLQL